MSKQPPPAPTASAVGPCPTLIQISRTPRHWKFTQHYRTTRPPHESNENIYNFEAEHKANSVKRLVDGNEKIKAIELTTKDWLVCIVNVYLLN